MAEFERHVSPAIREMMQIADEQRSIHRLGMTVPTNIDGDPWSPEDQYLYTIGKLAPDYAIVSCSCGWVSDPLVFIHGNEDEMIHEGHVTEELRVNVYRA